MTLKLSDNIRSFRKEHSLTQEQLAEVLGVTTGAVYKWEAGLSIPDLSLIVEMADFFDTSMDVLIGYEMKNNRVEETLNRIREYIYNRDYTMIFEAEKHSKNTQIISGLSIAVRGCITSSDWSWPIKKSSGVPWSCTKKPVFF